MLLINIPVERIYLSMKHYITHLATAAFLTVFASAAVAECSAEYKAKQDNPLRLEHGTMIVTGPCSISDAEPKVEAVLEAEGWTLLKILSVSES